MQTKSTRPDGKRNYTDGVRVVHHRRPLVRNVLVAVAWALLFAGCRSSSSHPDRDAGRPDAMPVDRQDIDPRSRLGVVIATITASDAEILRDRPVLAAQKYAIMAADPFAFFRGSLGLFLFDWKDAVRGLQATAFPAGGADPFGLGDAHPENFGTMRTRTGQMRVEPNDFDTADRLPYLWDVRRFAVGMCLAARRSNSDDLAQRAAVGALDAAIVRATVTSYTNAMATLATAAPRPAIEPGQGNVVLDDLFTRAIADGDRRDELAQLTIVDDVRKLVRGNFNPLQAGDVTRDLPARGRLAVSQTLADYRGTLTMPPAANELVPLDAVQEFGQGIGSYPRIRSLVLLRGGSANKDDDRIIEMKELPAQGTLPLPINSTFATPQERILAALTAAWTERGADPLWGTGTWLGIPIQIRTESAGFKTVRVARLVGALGTADAISGLGVDLMRLIARMHAAPVAGGTSFASPIAAAIAGNVGGFVDEQTRIGMAYCDQVMSDWLLFQQALSQLGPTLGVPGDSTHAPTAELRVLYDPNVDPGQAGVDPVVAPVIINEVSASGGPDYVELTNATSSDQSIAGFGVADSDADGGPRFSQTARFSLGATLTSGGKVVVVGGFAMPMPDLQTTCVPGLASCYQAQWGISAANGETMFFLSPDNVIVDQVSYPRNALPTGNSWGRLPDARGPFSAGAASAGGINTP